MTFYAARGWICVLSDLEGKRYQKYLFAPDGWQEAADGSYRWKLITEEYLGHEISFELHNGQKAEKKKTGKRMRKVLLYWSKADAEMAAKKREEKLKKAEKDARYDGYFAIITSEFDYDAEKIREVYHGLWRMEESFRIMKSDFDARPVYLNKREHIRAHFLICFVSLVILRLMQNGMCPCRLSVEKISEALRGANCLLERGSYVRLLDMGERSGMRKDWIKKAGRLQEIF